MIFLITYDLNSSEKDYSSLYKEIKSLGDSVHPLESTWFLESNENANAIAERLKNVMDEKDCFLVLEFSNDIQKQGWLPRNAWEWVNSKMGN